MIWEYAIMQVRADGGSFLAAAWVDDQEMYSRRLSSFYWSVPLGDMGREGWELVAASPENASASDHRGTMNFFFKRLSISKNTAEEWNQNPRL